MGLSCAMAIARGGDPAMHTVRNRSAISRKAKANSRLPKGQPPFLPPDARNSVPPGFPANILVAPPRGAVIKAVPLPAPESEPRAEAEALLILPERPAKPARRKAASPRKTQRKAKARKPGPRKAATLPRKPRKETGAAAVSPAPAALPLPPVQPPSAPAPLPPSRAVVRTGGGMVQKIVRWLDALGSALIGQPLTHRRRKVVLPKARQALQRRPLAERMPTARQPIVTAAGAGDELHLLRLENDRLNRELQLLKAALRNAGSARTPA